MINILSNNTPFKVQKLIPWLMLISFKDHESNYWLKIGFCLFHSINKIPYNTLTSFHLNIFSLNDVSITISKVICFILVSLCFGCCCCYCYCYCCYLGSILFFHRSKIKSDWTQDYLNCIIGYFFRFGCCC